MGSAGREQNWDLSRVPIVSLGSHGAAAVPQWCNVPLRCPWNLIESLVEAWRWPFQCFGSTDTRLYIDLDKYCFPPRVVEPVVNALDMNCVEGGGSVGVDWGFVVFPEDLVVEQGAGLGGVVVKDVTCFAVDWVWQSGGLRFYAALGLLTVCSGHISLVLRDWKVRIEQATCWRLVRGKPAAEGGSWETRDGSRSSEFVCRYCFLLFTPSGYQISITENASISLSIPRETRGPNVADVGLPSTSAL